jgi:uncharacterized membrane protein
MRVTILEWGYWILISLVFLLLASGMARYFHPYQNEQRLGAIILISFIFISMLIRYSVSDKHDLFFSEFDQLLKVFNL